MITYCMTSTYKIAKENFSSFYYFLLKPDLVFTIDIPSVDAYRKGRNSIVATVALKLFG